MNRVVPGCLPGVYVDAPKQACALGLPCPPQVVGQVGQAAEPAWEVKVVRGLRPGGEEWFHEWRVFSWASEGNRGILPRPPGQSKILVISQGFPGPRSGQAASCEAPKLVGPLHLAMFDSQWSESHAHPEIGIEVTVRGEGSVGNGDGCGLQRVRIATVRKPSEGILPKAIPVARDRLDEKGETSIPAEAETTRIRLAKRAPTQTMDGRTTGGPSGPSRT